METNEMLNLQEIEQLCLAYMDCNLSRLQEKELELVLMCSGLTSPIITEVRNLMGLTPSMQKADLNTNILRKAKLRGSKSTGIAACITIIVIICACFWGIYRPMEMVNELYVCADGKVLTGYSAKTVVNDTEKETMSMFRAIIEDVEYEQCLSKQYMNSIKE